MNMTQETDVLKHENPDLSQLLGELQEFIHRAAQESTPVPTLRQFTSRWSGLQLKYAPLYHGGVGVRSHRPR